MPTKTKCDRSETMRRVKSTGTSLEMLLRRRLWQAGVRYRVVNKVKGKPDIVFHGKRIAIFIDSCYWHGCPIHCRMPSSNQEYWNRKIGRNIARDAEVTKALLEDGWTVIRVWEHQLKDDLEEQVTRILASLQRA